MQNARFYGRFFALRGIFVKFYLQKKIKQSKIRATKNFSSFCKTYFASSLRKLLNSKISLG